MARLHSFLWLYNIPLLYISSLWGGGFPVFIHPSTDGHLSCFQVLMPVNNAAVTVGVHGSLWTCIFTFCAWTRRMEAPDCVLCAWEEAAMLTTRRNRGVLLPFGLCEDRVSTETTWDAVQEVLPLFNHEFTYIQTRGHSFCILGNNSIQLCCVAQMAATLATGSSWLLCSEPFLTSWHRGCSRLGVPTTAHWPAFSSREWCQRPASEPSMCFSAPEALLAPGLPRGRARNECVCINLRAGVCVCM